MSTTDPMSADVDALTRRHTEHIGGEPRKDSDRVGMSVGEFRAIIAALERGVEERADLLNKLMLAEQRAERVEAAARALYYAAIEANKFILHMPDCPAVGAQGPCDSGCQNAADGLERAIALVNVALAAAPEGSDGGCDHEDCDGHFCEECEKTLAWKPVGWWIAEVESKFPGLKVIHRTLAAAGALAAAPEDRADLPDKLIDAEQRADRAQLRVEQTDVAIRQVKEDNEKLRRALAWWDEHLPSCAKWTHVTERVGSLDVCNGEDVLDEEKACTCGYEERWTFLASVPNENGKLRTEVRRYFQVPFEDDIAEQFPLMAQLARERLLSDIEEAKAIERAETGSEGPWT